MPYQTFEDQIGDSNSPMKFRRMNFNDDMVRDKTIIDFGCNEGYFCFELQKMGAGMIIGIDKNQGFIDLANKRNNSSNIEFICGNIDVLNNMKDESINIIIIASALHYMSDPGQRNDKDIPIIFEEIHRLLKPNGMFVFEGGVKKCNSNEFIELKRSRDKVYHPTNIKIEKIFKKMFNDCKYVGPSVNQNGDIIPRHVYHCTK